MSSSEPEAFVRFDTGVDACEVLLTQVVGERLEPAVLLAVIESARNEAFRYRQWYVRLVGISLNGVELFDVESRLLCQFVGVIVPGDVLV